MTNTPQNGGIVMSNPRRPPRTTLIESRMLHLILWFGLAITLPMPCRRQIVLARRKMDEDELRHEWFHAWQIVDWGWCRYLWRHAAARIRERSWTAPLSDVEFPAYKVQYPHMSDADLVAYLRGENK